MMKYRFEIRVNLRGGESFSERRSRQINTVEKLKENFSGIEIENDLVLASITIRNLTKEEYKAIKKYLNAKKREVWIMANI